MGDESKTECFTRADEGCDGTAEGANAVNEQTQTDQNQKPETD
jgi:hypothetical protein